MVMLVLCLCQKRNSLIWHSHADKYCITDLVREVLTCKPLNKKNSCCEISQQESLCVTMLQHLNLGCTSSCHQQGHLEMVKERQDSTYWQCKDIFVYLDPGLCKYQAKARHKVLHSLSQVTTALWWIDVLVLSAEI